MAWPIWPAGLEPARSPVHVRNEIAAPAPVDAVWQWLVRADLWPTWFARASRVRFERGGPELRLGSVVVWRMLNATIRVTVKICEPPHRLDWEGGAAGVHAYHAWLIEPAAGGSRIVTEETERGPLPWLLRWYLRAALHGAHGDWLASLVRVASNGPPAAAVE